MAAAPHDPTFEHAADATAAGEHAAGGAFPPFDATLFASQLFWFALTFGSLYFIVSRFVLPKVASVLAQRAATVKGDLDAAAIQSAAAEDARAAMERGAAKARNDARAMIEKARADMQAKLTAEQESAEARLATRIRAAEAKVDAERAKALAEIPAIAANLAREIADKLAPMGARS